MNCIECGGTIKQTPCQYCGWRPNRLVDGSIDFESDCRMHTPDAPMYDDRVVLARINYSAYLAPLNVRQSGRAARDRTKHTPHTNRYVTGALSSVVALLFSLATPITSVWLTANGILVLITAQMEQLGDTAIEVLQDFSNVGFDNAFSLPDSVSVFIVSAQQAGYNSLWLLGGFAICMLPPFFYIVAGISALIAPRLCRFALILGGALTGLGAGFSTYNLFQLLAAIPLAGPYACAGYVMPCGALATLLAAITGVKWMGR